jgi:tRNA(adenine34) deaminase
MLVERDDEYYMKEALKEARKAMLLDEVPVGAVIVCDGRIIARSHNLSERLNDATAHAEMQAITAASGHLGAKYLNECTLFVTVEPCAMCAGAAYWSQLGRIVYGTDDEKRGYTTFSRDIMHPAAEITRGVLADECSLLMKEFFRSKR